MMRKYLRRICVVIFGIAIIWIATKIYGRFAQMKSEYTTAQTIRVTDEYVQKTHKWPASWKDLGPDREKGSDYVKMQFNVDVEKLTQNLDLLKLTITPLENHYYTYPHSDYDFRQLQQSLKDALKANDEAKMR